MIIKTKGIVLNYIKYKESSIICKIYTQSQGLQSFIVNGVRKSKNSQLSIYQPLNKIDLIFYMKKNSTLHRIKESKIHIIYKSLHIEISKISICFFLSEFLSKVLSFEEDQNQKFEFISKSINHFDRIENDFNDFHVKFLIKLSYYYGVGISNHKQLTVYDGSDVIISKYIDQCINDDYDIITKSNNILRNKVINLIIEYYKNNLDINFNINSNNVLNEIFK